MAIAGKIQQGVGIDVSEYAITRAKESADMAGLSNLEFNTYDIIQLGEAEDYQSRFDKVLMMDISEHLYDDTLLKFLYSAKSILKPGGSLILHTPNANYYLERMKARNFILKQFESHIAVRNFQQHVPLLQSAGFSEIEVKYLPHYNRVLGTLDRVLSQIPMIKTLFQARILITANLP
jgi:cyclopropane fatty-acyl-phospholipid synthase-like methyltransferase